MKAQIVDFKPCAGGYVVSFQTNEDIRSLYEDLKGKDIEVTAKRYRRRRSLSANAYAWVLIDQVAAKMYLPKETVYKSYIENLGGNTGVLTIEDEAVDMFRRSWESRGLGWLTEVSPSGWDGYTDIIFYYGSSVFDTEQMARFIDLIVQDCRSLGIETKDPNDIESLLEAWDGR